MNAPKFPPKFLQGGEEENMAEADIERVLFTREAIEGRVSELGKLIAEDFAGRREGPIVLGILKGAYLTDLAVALALDKHSTPDTRNSGALRPPDRRSRSRR